MQVPRHYTPQFRTCERPLVTVVVYQASGDATLLRCLRGLKRLESESRLQILVSKQGADDTFQGTGQVACGPNRDLVGVLRAAAAQAGAPYLYTLSSRAVPLPGSIKSLLDLLESDATVGLAVPMIRPVERGIWGRVLDSRIAFVRDVDTALAECFMTRTDLLRSIDWDVDEVKSAPDVMAELCTQMRSRGLRCLYQPRSVVLVDDIRRQHEAHDRAHTALVIDERVPFEDRDSGSRRMASMLRHWRTLGWSVIFGSVDRRPYEPYSERLRQDGIELILGFSRADLTRLASRGTRIDCVWLSRPHVASRYLDFVRAIEPQATVVYDTVDLHYVRLSRQASVLGRRMGAEVMEQRELALARRADRVIVTSPLEADTLRAKGLTTVSVVGLSESLLSEVAGFEVRSGLLFLGNYAHAPNVDAALWLVRDIMPAIRKRLPGVTLTLAGSEPPLAVKRLSSSSICVPGFVEDLAELFSQHKVFVAPIRFGAGIKGKIIQALAAGIPIVTTGTGAEGISTGDHELVIADDEQTFAQAVSQLYEEKTKWSAYSRAARAAALRFTPAVQCRQLQAVLEELDWQ